MIYFLVNSDYAYAYMRQDSRQLYTKYYYNSGTYYAGSTFAGTYTRDGWYYYSGSTTNYTYAYNKTYYVGTVASTYGYKYNKTYYVGTTASTYKYRYNKTYYRGYYTVYDNKVESTPVYGLEYITCRSYYGNTQLGCRYYWHYYDTGMSYYNVSSNSSFSRMDTWKTGATQSQNKYYIYNVYYYNDGSYAVIRMYVTRYYFVNGNWCWSGYLTSYAKWFITNEGYAYQYSYSDKYYGYYRYQYVATYKKYYGYYKYTYTATYKNYYNYYRYTYISSYTRYYGYYYYYYANYKYYYNWYYSGPFGSNYYTYTRTYLYK